MKVKLTKETFEVGKIAEALVREFCHVLGSGIPMCRYCGSKGLPFDQESIKHKDDCPVLEAKRFLERT